MIPSCFCRSIRDRSYRARVKTGARRDFADRRKSIALRGPCSAQARGDHWATLSCYAQARCGHPWPPARRIRRALGHPSNACVGPLEAAGKTFCAPAILLRAESPVVCRRGKPRRRMRRPCFSRRDQRIRAPVPVLRFRLSLNPRAPNAHYGEVLFTIRETPMCSHVLATRPWIAGFTWSLRSGVCQAGSRRRLAAGRVDYRLLLWKRPVAGAPAE